MASFNLPCDPSGIYYGSSAANLVNVAADNAVFNEEVQAATIVCENLSVSGTTTVTNLQQVNLQAPVLELAVGNTTGDATLSGITTTYKGPTQQLYAGIVRSPGATDGIWHLVKDGTTPSLTGSTAADLSVGKLYASNLYSTAQLQAGSIQVTNDVSAASYTAGTSVLDSAHLSTTAVDTTNIVYTGTVENHDGSVKLDDGTGSLTVVEVNTDSLNASGTSILGVTKVKGEVLCYPSIPYDEAIGESVVPSLQIDGQGITAVDVAATSMTCSANPLNVIGELSSIADFLTTLTGLPNFPFVQMSSLGNLSCYSPLSTGGTIYCSGGATVGGQASVATLKVVAPAGIQGTYQTQAANNFSLGVGSTLVPTEVSASHSHIFGNIDFGDTDHRNDTVTFWGPVVFGQADPDEPTANFYGPFTLGELVQPEPFTCYTSTSNILAYIVKTQIPNGDGTFTSSNKPGTGVITITAEADVSITSVGGLTLEDDLEIQMTVPDVNITGNLTVDGFIKSGGKLIEDIAKGAAQDFMSGLGTAGGAAGAAGGAVSGFLSSIFGGHSSSSTDSSGNTTYQANLTPNAVVYTTSDGNNVAANNAFTYQNGTVGVGSVLVSGNYQFLDSTLLANGLPMPAFAVSGNKTITKTYTANSSTTSLTVTTPSDYNFSLGSQGATVIFSGTLNAPGPFFLNLTWGSVSTSQSVANGSSSWSYTWNLLPGDVLNALASSPSTISVIPTDPVTYNFISCTISVSMVYTTGIVGLIGLSGGFNTSNNTLDDGAGAATLKTLAVTGAVSAGSLSVNGQSVTGVFSTTNGISLASPASGQYLTYNGTNWVNSTLPAYPTNSSFNLSGLGDVFFGTLQTNQFLQWSGTKWQNATNIFCSGSIAAASNNLNFHIAPYTGNKVGFTNAGQSAWGLYVTDNGSTPKANTFLNTLDDGSGNMTVAGKITSNAPSSTRNTFILNNSGLGVGASGNGATIAYQENGTQYWELFNHPNSVGTYVAANDYLAFWYDGTGAGSKLKLFGNGQLLSLNNTLDDGISGNMTLKGSLTLTNTASNNTLIAPTWPTNPKISVTGQTALPNQVWSYSNTNSTAVAAGVAMVLGSGNMTSQVAVGTAAASTVVFTGTLSATTGDTVTFTWGTLTTSTTVANGSSAINYTWNLTAANANAVAGPSAAFSITAAGAALGITTCTVAVTLNYTKYYPMTSITSGLQTSNILGNPNGNILDDGYGNMTLRGMFTSATVGGMLAYNFTGITLPYTPVTTDVWIWVSAGSGVFTMPPGNIGRVFYLVIGSTVPSSISFSGNMNVNGLRLNLPSSFVPTAWTLYICSYMTGNQWYVMGGNIFGANLTGPGLQLTNAATNNALTTVVPTVSVTSNTAIARVYTLNGSNSTAVAATVAMTVATLPSTLPTNYVSGSGLASTIVFTGTLSATTGSVVTFAWGTLNTTTTIASGSSAINFTWNLTAANITTAFLVNSTVTMTGTSLGITTATAALTINYNQYTPVSKVASGLSSLNNVFDDGYGNATVTGSTNINGGMVTHQNWVNPPYTVTTSDYMVYVNQLTSGTVTLPATAASGQTFIISISSGASANCTVAASTSIRYAGSSAASVTMVIGSTAVFVWLATGIYAAYGDIVIPAVSNLTDVSLSTLSNTQYLGWDSASSKWKNMTIPSTTSNSSYFLSGLGDVAFGTLANNQVVTYNSTTSKWVNSLPLLANSADVSLGTISNLQYLGYNTATSKWQNMTLPATSSNTIAGLTDVSLSTLSNGQFLTYNTSTTKWNNTTQVIPTNSSFNLDNLSNCSMSTKSTGQLLEWNGTAWTNWTLPAYPTNSSFSLDSLSNVSMTTKSNSQYVGWNGTAWTNMSIPATTPNSSYFYNQLGDVSLTSLASGQHMQWNGTAWVNVTNSLDNLSNYSVTGTKTTGQLLEWNGTAWTNWTLPAYPTNSSFNLSGLADVTITSIATNQLLQWNGTKFINVTNLTLPAAGTITTTGAISVGGITGTSLALGSGTITTTGTISIGGITGTSLALGSGAITTTGTVSSGTHTVTGTLNTGSLVATSDIQFNSANRRSIYPSGASVPANCDIQIRSAGSTGTLQLNADNAGPITAGGPLSVVNALSCIPNGTTSNLYSLSTGTGQGPYNNQFWSTLQSAGAYGGLRYNSGANNYTLKTDGTTALGAAIIKGTAGIDLYAFNVSSTTDVTQTPTQMQSWCTASFGIGTTTLRNATTSVTGTLGVTGNTSLSTVSTSGLATLNSATVTNALTASGFITANGGMGFKQTQYSGTSGYTILNTDTWIYVTSGASGTLTLPTAPVAGQTVYISLNSGSTGVTVTAGGTKNIERNGLTTTTMFLPALSTARFIYSATTVSLWVAYTSSNVVTNSITAGSINAYNGGVFLDANLNFNFSAGSTNSYAYSVVGLNNSNMFTVYNQTASNTGSQVNTYHNILDDGNGNVRINCPGSAAPMTMINNTLSGYMTTEMGKAADTLGGASYNAAFFQYFHSADNSSTANFARLGVTGGVGLTVYGNNRITTGGGSTLDDGSGNMTVNGTFGGNVALSKWVPGHSNAGAFIHAYGHGCNNATDSQYNLNYYFPSGNLVVYSLIYGVNYIDSSYAYYSNSVYSFDSPPHLNGASFYFINDSGTSLQINNVICGANNSSSGSHTNYSVGNGRCLYFICGGGNWWLCNET